MNRQLVFRRVAFSIAMAFFVVGPASADPLSFTTGLKLWLSADQGVTLSGSTVTGWADQSGNGHDGTHTTGAPQLVSSAINGLPAISFNGAGDYFSLANNQVLSSDSFTIFAVATDTGANAGDREIYSNWDGVNSWSSVFMGTSDGQPTTRTARFTDGLSAVDLLAAPASPFILSGVYTGGVNAQMFKNGVLVASALQNGLPASDLNPNGQRDVSTPSFIGQQGSFAGEYWQGLVGEVLVYEGALTTAQQQEVYSYLHTKWVPEPGSMLLLGIGIVSLALRGMVRRRTRGATT